MNQKMRRALRRAGCALTAGLLGVAGPAWAQAPSPYRVSPFGPGAYHATQYSAAFDGQAAGAVATLPAGLAEGSARLEEIKIELALLSDPATFSWNLGARAQGT
ncbi:MAG TPA: hypothetical protein VFA26_08830, partial [Gemmataceae bacterium]|nr:hypothetical protein [Gemmataceae bacterium]